MRIKWFGHACFNMVSEERTTIITDPFDSTVGYDIPNVEADLVTVSHQHFDHNCTDWINGNFKLIDQPGEYSYKDIQLKGINTFHDEVGGQKRGENIVFNFMMDELNICHLGDLGHVPNDLQIENIGNVDILLIPVGGIFTVNAEEATKVVEILNPNVVIPMHYKTPKLKFNLASVDQFIDKLGRERVVNLSQVEITKNNISGFKDKVIIFEYN